MQRFVRVSLAVALMAVLHTSLSLAGQRKKQYSSWNEIAVEMVLRLDEADAKYLAGDVEGAKSSVNDAYFGFYEKMGFERTVMAYISGKRVSLVEYKFSYVKKQMTRNEPKDDILAELAGIGRMLKEDADQLDGKTEGAPQENEEFIVPTEEEISAFDAAVSPEGLTPEEFEKLKIEYIQEMRKSQEGK